MLFTACSLVAGVVPVAAGMADTTAAAPPVNTGVQLAQAGAIPKSDQKTPESIIVKAQRRLVKEKNSPSAVTELGQSAIAQTGISGSPQTLLRQAPSIYVYQQSIGDSAPELTIRGARGLETAQTLDDVPVQDLLAPGSSSIANNIGGIYTLSQISGVSIYPGIAYPNKNTFGTIGGTIAYDTKRPSNDFYIDVLGSVGSFQTYRTGFELNSGSLDGLLGSGDNAPKLLLNYYNLQTAGFIDYTGTRENEMEFAFDKPYDDGLSKFQATVLYNTGNGYIQNEPIPLPYLNKNGLFSNYPTSQDFGFESNDYLTIILKDSTYINDYLNVGLAGFFLKNDNSTETYGSLAVSPPFGDFNPAAVGTGFNAAAPFINTPAGFNYGAYYGPSSGANYKAGVYPYNPAAAYPVGTAACPTYIVNEYNAAGETAPCGLNAELGVGQSYTYGVQPRVTILPPEIFGIGNVIQLGGLVAKETSPSTRSYFGGYPTVPQTASNLDNIFGGGFDGGTQRTIYQAFIQDKIDLLDNTLHITPGATLEGTFSSFRQSNEFSFNTFSYINYKSYKWDRDYLPFFNISYDMDKVLPALKGLNFYGSTGQSALFAPVTDFSPNAAGTPPGASIVHLYEGGVKYNTSNVALSLDYFYQKVDRDFGFYTSESGPTIGQTIYNNNGQREFKGVEGNIQYVLTPNIELFANFSHVLAKYLKTDFAFTTVAEDQYGVAIKGDPVTNVPDWLSTFGVDFNKKSVLVQDDAFDARFSGTYTGHQSTTYDISGFSPFPNFPGLAVSDQYGAVPGTDYTLHECQSVYPKVYPQNPALAGQSAAAPGCTRFSQLSGATVYDPNGGISPFVVFNLDMNYTLPTPTLPVIKQVKFDLNIQNLFDQRFFQYYYKQVSPSACPITKSNPVGSQYNCSLEFADGIPGEPFSVFFTVTARF
jgi:iron complex outermembrane receptor protein